ncbi:KH domain-containing protein [candidate division WWE3 bacterium]|nr:KH domain-containing protein [candidate division WWE3 bacterium]
MKELLQYLVIKILPHGNDAKIEESIEDNGTVRFTLITHPEDIGLAIGKEGRTAKALREMLKIQAIQQNKRVYLDIKSSEEVETLPTAEDLLG